MYEAAVEPKRLANIPAAHHNDPSLLDGAELLAEVGAFLDEWLRH